MSNLNSQNKDEKQNEAMKRSPLLSKERLLYNIPAWIAILACVIMWFIPTGFEDALIYRNSDHTTARVLKVNNDGLEDTGVIVVGEQKAEVEILSGKFKGRTASAFNLLNGSLEFDKKFDVGDIARVVIDHSNDNIDSVNLIDHDRIPYEILFFLIFAVLLVFVAGRTGFRSLISFVLTVLAIWKILVPQILQGANPLTLGMVTILALTAIIILPIYGFSYRSLAAIVGCSLGTIATGTLGAIGTKLFRIHGAVMPKAESLLHAGYRHLDLTQIFMMAIFIGASGALMDLGVDITSSVAEVIAKKPNIEWKEAYRSGMNVGRAAMGTMTTTLLLAYSGGFISVMMVFMAQGTPLMNILNYKDIAAEILHTLVGSIGLVLVAPVTAISSAVLLCNFGKREILYNEFKQLQAEKLIPKNKDFVYEEFVQGILQETEDKVHEVELLEQGEAEA